MLFSCSLLLAPFFLLTSCSTQKNTAASRFWHAFNARYNTYYNGSQAFIEGSETQENGHQDNYTELLPLYPSSNKTTRTLGAGQFDRTIEKMEKAIKLHSIKKRPQWKPGKRKTQSDVEWLNRREYNPFLWKAWLLMGKAQFQKGEFEEAAATFSYMNRLYQTQPHIRGIARAWLTKSYTEMGWLYEAEDVIRSQRRDSLDWRAEDDWDYAYADYYIHNGQYTEAIPYLEKVIKHERRRKQRAREWYIMGQLQALTGNREEAYYAYKRVLRLNPPYQLAFNARIAQTEVMAAGQARKMIGRLKRMASSDNNKEYLDQVYYAIGNIYLAERDTANAIWAYETGNEKATRSGIEKGVLLLRLGDLYWLREKYSDARRCYGEAIGLLDRERPDYEQLSKRSKVLDELVPYTEIIHMQDSLQALARMPEAERLAAIDRVIEQLKKKEREEELARLEAESEQLQQQNQNQNNNLSTSPTTPIATQQSGTWYFYNPQAVSQGKQQFQRLWGKRENVDNWQRTNKTVVALEPTDNPEAQDNLDNPDNADNPDNPETPTDGAEETADSLSADPHTREYYLAQIPFTEEQLATSNALLADGLFHAGIILKDKLDNLRLSERMLTRLTSQHTDYEHNDEAWYHLYLLYARQGRMAEAQLCLNHLTTNYPESQWTILLNDPYYEENARFGTHIEDSIYAATYDAFRENRFDVVKANTALSADRFPQGFHRPKFIFIEGLSLLNEGRADECLEHMKEVVAKYPESEVSELAGMIVKGVQEGRRLHGGTFDLGDVWSRRDSVLNRRDSIAADTLSTTRDTRFAFVIAYRTDSVNGNQLLYELARYNFTNYLVRNFEITVDHGEGISRMIVSGFLSYDEVRQYVRLLYADEQMNAALTGCRHLLISEENLPKLGTSFSYNDYDEFYERELAPLDISNEQLLSNPETVVEEPEEEEDDGNNGNDTNADDDLFGPDTPQNNGYIEFDEDFYR
ncbi:MAG: tetratricopeptide repeat protein [Prevotella sp.]|nr:tetratricopeptide repeat protein [Prevotella sp.]